MRHWYYSVGIELEMFVGADYPATAYDTIHDVIHQSIAHLDNDRFPRVVCNLVAEVTDWKIKPVMCSVGKLDDKSRVTWPPFKEVTFLAKSKRSKVPK